MSHLARISKLQFLFGEYSWLSLLKKYIYCEFYALWLREITHLYPNNAQNESRSPVLIQHRSSSNSREQTSWHQKLIKMTKGSQTLKKATTSTQNADLVAALLLALEEKIEGKGLTLSDLSLSSTGSPNHSLVSTPSTTAWFSIPSAFLCLSLILFLQCLLYKQSVCHKESKSLHLLQRTSLQ